MKIVKSDKKTRTILSKVITSDEYYSCEIDFALIEVTENISKIAQATTTILSEAKEKLENDFGVGYAPVQVTFFISNTTFINNSFNDILGLDEIDFGNEDYIFVEDVDLNKVDAFMTITEKKRDEERKRLREQGVDWYSPEMPEALETIYQDCDMIKADVNAITFDCYVKHTNALLETATIYKKDLQ